ncbi:MAG: GspE/PulE family protein [Peptoniphilaceae bacterium]
MDILFENLLKIVDKNISYKYNVVPKSIIDDKVIFWIAEYNKNTEISLKLILKKDVGFDKCSFDELEIYRRNTYPKSDLSNIKNLLDDFSLSAIKNEETFQIENTNSKIIKFLDEIISYAIENNSSDIHMDAYEDFSKIRIRIDGVLKDLIEINKSISRLMINRIKVLSNLDYTVKNIPQDGRFTYNYGSKLIDIRVAIVPTIFSEKVVLRVLNKKDAILTKSAIGVKGFQEELIDKMISQPNGLILSVGPTGSGKTTSLITFLKELQNEETNIITIEDPVEYKIEGINQIEINEQVGMDFNSGLKSILRLDPDKIMVGEIRDVNTARTALRASITGHLVLSTLHANDSPSAIYRLKDMGIENYLISAGVVGIISQRLVRKLCKCKVRNKSYVELYNETLDVYKNVGCKYCNNGYNGRIAVYEILILNDKLKEAINSNISLEEFRKLCIKEGMVTLKESMRNILLNGVTTVEEVYKNIVTIGEP